MAMGKCQNHNRRRLENLMVNKLLDDTQHEILFPSKKCVGGAERSQVEDVFLPPSHLLRFSSLSANGAQPSVLTTQPSMCSIEHSHNHTAVDVQHRT
ncbi:hypothetical protein MKW98_001743 [Papaver atlanticum]|uniref:Uncharacterized protein n=1 Tax=Papaver atlanticum TaxID=357466 RepID=A0AAD4S721_9MAGN|nr:hypothetical protein MKW98_001743 [Papaver atlanticum]